ncbi:hypothetical protein DSO57_1011659 [Entomophthora muscae]|uniref:Uncharacterized protein n=1 Tax=Entomophthora muscae TaxID=34485 RepID=A0ACC2S897_9FUNG|nr:hypothetical protein DSO57_1011659 [Entomophthora muscae]
MSCLKSILVSFSLLYGTGLGQWASTPANLVPYLGQVEQNGTRLCLGFFKSPIKFVAPATCLHLKSSVDLVKVQVVNGRPQIALLPSTDIALHKFWSKSYPFHYNKGSATAISQDKDVPEIKAYDFKHEGPGFIVVQLSADGSSKARQFVQIPDSECYDIYLGRIKVAINKQEFLKGMFCITEKEQPLKGPLNRSLRGAPVFVDLASDNFIAGIYSARVKQSKRNVYLFTKVYDI